MVGFFNLRLGWAVIDKLEVQYLIEKNFGKLLVYIEAYGSSISFRFIELIM